MEKKYYNSLTTLLEYNQLVKKERNIEAGLEVVKILLTEKAIEDILTAIKEIDARYEQKKEETGIREKSAKQEKQEKRKKSRARLQKLPFLAFIFQTRSAIARYCRDIGLAKPRFFGLFYHLTNDATRLLRDIIDNVLTQVLPVTENIIENGWKILEPKKYNVFYFLNSFLNTFSHRIVFEKKDISMNLKFVRSFADDYFTLLNNPESINLLKEGILFIYGTGNENAGNAIKVMDTLFERKKRLSLYNYIFSLYAIHYRRIITLENVIASRNIGDIPDLRYLTTPRVKYLIQTYCDKIKSEQSINESKLFFMKYIHDGETEIVTDFILLYHNPRFKSDFFKENIIESCDGFLNALIKYSLPFLFEPLNLFTDKNSITTVIFENIWDTFLKKLNKYLTELQHLKNELKAHITFEVYKKFFHEKKPLESEKIEKTCLFIREIHDELCDFYKIFNRLQYNDYRLTYTEDKDLLLHILETKEQTYRDIQRERFIPWSNYKAAEYDGVTVSVIMEKITALTGTFLNIFEYEEITRPLKDRDRLMSENKKNMETLIRLTV